MLGKLESVLLREIWPHEAGDFTSWLFDNIDILNEQLGLDLIPIEKEKPVGSFNVDILAKDSSGRQAIIENQLEKTDHDHLGKFITYFSNLNAKIGIWISPSPRPEHVAAIEYLNQVVPEDTKFYLIRLQTYRIGNSEPAPLFTIEAGPSEQLREVGEVKRELAHRDKQQYKFFEQLLSRFNEKTNLFSNVSPKGYQNGIGTGAGKSGLSWGLLIMKKIGKVDLFLNAADGEVNRTRFEFLEKRKTEIEKAFESSLVWDFKEGRKQHYIRSISDIGGLEDEKKWPEIHQDLIARLIKLERALRNHIKELP